MMDVKTDDIELKRCIDAFNYLADANYPEILEWAPTDFYLKSGKQISINSWRRFLLDNKIQQWYAEEEQIILRQKRAKLISKLDINTSPAQSTALNSLLQEQKRRGEDENKTIIIYSFVDLNKAEKENPLIEKPNTIPKSIKKSLYNPKDPGNF